MRWLLLDVGGVLEVTDDATWPGDFEARWADRLGLAVEDFRGRVQAADLPDAGRREGVEEEFWQRYGAAVGAGRSELASMRADFWDCYCGEVDEELLAALHGLIGQVGLAVLSNAGDGARREEERRFGFSRLFDPICYSHELGVAKPEPAAYRAALRAMAARPHDVLFVDDTPEHVEGARALGIHALHHVDTSATVSAVRAWAGGSQQP